MLYLLLSIICSAGLVLMFKYFGWKGIPVFPAIVVNYWSATLCAWWFLPDHTTLLSAHLLSAPWLGLSLALGALFIIIFNLTGITTLLFGVSTASVAFKLGLIFPVALAFLFYGESVTWLKAIGIVLAFPAVVFTSSASPSTTIGKAPHPLLPVLVFIGSGACDSLTQFANKKYLMNRDMEEFSLFLFLSATATGTLWYGYNLWKGTSTLDKRSVPGGIVLGIINYFSFLFLLKALATLEWGSSVIFPMSNLGVVGLSTVAGVIIFNEKLSRLNLAGLAFALGSMLLILWSNL